METAGLFLIFGRVCAGFMWMWMGSVTGDDSCGFGVLCLLVILLGLGLVGLANLHFS